MTEPIYHSVREFAEVYRISRWEINRYIALGVVEPRRIGGNYQMSETDMMRIARYNTQMREKKARLTGGESGKGKVG